MRLVVQDFADFYHRLARTHAHTHASIHTHAQTRVRAHMSMHDDKSCTSGMEYFDMGQLIEDGADYKADRYVN